MGVLPGLLRARANQPQALPTFSNSAGGGAPVSTWMPLNAVSKGAASRWQQVAWCTVSLSRAQAKREDLGQSSRLGSFLHRFACLKARLAPNGDGQAWGRPRGALRRARRSWIGGLRREKALDAPDRFSWRVKMPRWKRKLAVRPPEPCQALSGVLHLSLHYLQQCGPASSPQPPTHKPRQRLQASSSLPLALEATCKASEGICSSLEAAAAVQLGAQPPNSPLAARGNDQLPEPCSADDGEGKWGVRGDAAWFGGCRRRRRGGALTPSAPLLLMPRGQSCCTCSELVCHGRPSHACTVSHLALQACLCAQQLCALVATGGGDRLV